MTRVLGGLTCLGVLSAMLVAGCSSEGSGVEARPAGRTEKGPGFVSGVSNEPAKAPRPTFAPAPPGKESDAVRSRVTLSKASILGRTFLYGADLQYAGMSDGYSQDTYSTLAIGHMPAFFRIAGQTLQLVEDQSRLFESDVNKPVRLIHEFAIEAQNDLSVTIRITDGGQSILSFVEGSASAAARSSWVRSLSYDKKSDLLLMETSFEGTDGWVYEFMESLFPRDALVPADFAPISTDPEKEPLASRFNFLGGGGVYVDDGNGDRVQTEFASRFVIRGEETIDWYATANLPDEFYAEVKDGVEAWNRYSQAMWGRDMVRFVGRLPAGIKIGDPRYNVINWDSVAEAGAAWESQATDPLTGIQSHSVIYLPKAWFNIGKDFWERAELSDGAKTTQSKASAKFLENRRFLGRKVKASCTRDFARLRYDAAAQDPDAFGKELLKSTLFHEVGHALGLGHNFKGSVSFDLDNPGTYATTVMDYNNYDLDRAAFDAPGTSKGPLLEYDRQAISALYNHGADIHESDGIPAMCSDAEVPDPSAVDAVDPFCMQYDGGKDPTQFLARNIALFTRKDAVLGRTESLANAIPHATARLADPASVTDIAVAKAAVDEQVALLKNVLRHYAWTRMTSPATEAQWFLRAMIPGSESDGVDLVGLRGRAWDGISYVATFGALPDDASSALTLAIQSTKDWFVRTPAYAQLAFDAQSSTRLAAYRDLDKIPGWFSVTYIPIMRGAVLETLKHNPSLPLELVSVGGVRTDYEAKTIDLLEEAITGTVNGAKRPTAERIQAVSSLVTFGGIGRANAAIGRAQTMAQEELANATDSASRNELRALVTALGGGPL
ncbi:MAG: zinc-dependent metalloprotease [Polyangiaceae bacterium]